MIQWLVACQCSSSLGGMSRQQAFVRGSTVLSHSLRTEDKSPLPTFRLLSAREEKTYEYSSNEEQQSGRGFYLLQTHLLLPPRNVFLLLARVGLKLQQNFKVRKRISVETLQFCNLSEKEKWKTMEKSPVRLICWVAFGICWLPVWQDATLTRKHFLWCNVLRW